MEHDVKQETIKKERTSSIDFSKEIYMFSDAKNRGAKIIDVNQIIVISTLL